MKTDVGVWFVSLYVKSSASPCRSKKTPISPSLGGECESICKRRMLHSFYGSVTGGRYSIDEIEGLSILYDEDSFHLIIFLLSQVKEEVRKKTCS